jgi:hypothetical protein
MEYSADDFVFSRDAACQWARKYLDTPLLRVDGVETAIQAMMDDFRTRKRISVIQWDGGITVVEEGPDLELNARQLVSEAAGDRVAFEAAIRLGAEFLGCNERVPSALSVFLSGYLTGIVKRPGKRGPHRSKNYYRDLLICESIDMLMDLDFGQTRNDATEAQDSAYDIVCDALKGLGIQLTLKAIDAIWRAMPAEEKVLR